jgi:hypothetical protein
VVEDANDLPFVTGEQDTTRGSRASNAAATSAEGKLHLLPSSGQRDNLVHISIVRYRCSYVALFTVRSGWSMKLLVTFQDASVA